LIRPTTFAAGPTPKAFRAGLAKSSLAPWFFCLPKPKAGKALLGHEHLAADRDQMPMQNQMTTRAVTFLMQINGYSFHMTKIARNAQPEPH
jgi:hypothetical protein